MRIVAVVAVAVCCMASCGSDPLDSCFEEADGTLDCSYQDFTGVDLSGRNLRKIDLTGADLSDADLSGAILVGADLDHAVISGADFRNANLTQSSLRYLAVSSDYSEVPVRDLIAHRADFSGASLREADLHKARLYFARFRGADLRHAKLSAAIIYNADFSGADLSYSRFSNVQVNFFLSADFSGANLKGAEHLLRDWFLERLPCPYDGGLDFGFAISDWGPTGVHGDEETIWPSIGDSIKGVARACLD